ncbi:MFS transporter [Desulfoferrobacter suflitae]|uniref:MFS transporter n=1 Tax=Desulfoferrobacter suflitae TaxID=2865782 RepID=UPI0021644BC9|nr:MFS transporter [Desulfoferrobacter suflitae]MCK8601823.1 MFS transporter [Desulfoferrobacter suflitae]
MDRNADKEGGDSIGGWLNRNVLLFGLTSLLSDFCHEMATAILPQFMRTIGASAAVLGFIEGVADALSSFLKLGAGYQSDKIGHRKTWTAIGYLLTAIGKPLFAFAFAWPLILIGRVVAWLGRGIRGPLRDAMLAESVPSRYRGKAFGFHRAGDTAGAVLGPLAAFALLSLLARHPAFVQTLGRWVPFFADAPGGSFRIIFLLSLIPGLLSVVTFLLVKEKRRTPNHELDFIGAIRSMPKDYRYFLLGVGLFGMADFAPTLMILRASTVLEPQLGILEAARIAALLYLLRNAVYAAASYPIGALCDRFCRSRTLAVGYGIGAITFFGFAVALPALWWFTLCFASAGLFIAWEDTVEGAAVRDFVGESLAGTAYGLLGVVNGLGDFISSFVVGMLWTLASPAWGFSYAVIVAVGGTALMGTIRCRPAAK